MLIAVNHLGFRPADQGKQAVIWGDREYEEFQVVDLNEMGYNEIGPNARPHSIIFRGPLQKAECPWGRFWTADFTPLARPGIYLITLNDEYNSVPFQIRDDVYLRTMRKAFDYIHIQRCGQEVPGYHGPCHLDDALRRDDGRQVDAVGGWHDAGDLRKWMAFTQLLGMAIVKIKQLLDPDWHVFDGNEGDLLNELRWGNAYFHKMQDADGAVWHDVAGGVNGDNSDNHWTDNVRGTGDDRYINPVYDPVIQWEFVLLQAMSARVFKAADPAYAGICLTAAARAYEYARRRPAANIREAAWGAWALRELGEASGESSDGPLRREMAELVRRVLALQEKEYRFGQTAVKGFWYTDAGRSEPHRSSWDSAVPALSLLEVLDLPDLDPVLRDECVSAIRSYTDDYIRPLLQTNPFNMMPFSIYDRPCTEETYHRLEGGLLFRFFAPTSAWMHIGFAAGLTSHLLAHAVLLERAAGLLGAPELAVFGRRQVEWVMGANTERACLMTAEGINNPYPHSRFLGLIPGGIMNGFMGLADDRPFLDMNYAMDWRTTEYWSPHSFYYLWYVALAEGKTAI